MIKVVTGNAYLKKLLLLLEGARTSVDVMAYSFAIGSAAGKINKNSAPYEIALKLIELAKRKVKVRLYIEGSRETADRNRITANFLKKNGVEVVYGATHAKGLCVDKRFVYFGSTNLTQQSITKNNEANLLIDDKKMAKGFLEYFNFHWEGGTHGGIKLAPPFLADGDFKDAIVAMIDGARKRIEFAIYFFNHREIEEALIRAHDRGIKVTGFIHQHYSFALSYIYKNRATVKRLREAGVEDLHFSVPSTFSHAKYIAVDRKEFALGTGNWLVEDVLIHPQLYIHLKDPKVCLNLVRYLQWLIKNQSG